MKLAFEDSSNVVGSTSQTVLRTRLFKVLISEADSWITTCHQFPREKKSPGPTKLHVMDVMDFSWYLMDNICM